MDAFLAHHIVPKLEREMHNFAVNPANQQLASFNAVIGWMDMIKLDMIVNILLNTFFVKVGWVVQADVVSAVFILPLH